MDPFGENCSYRNPYRSSSCETTYGAPNTGYAPNPTLMSSPMPRMSNSMTQQGGKRRVRRNKTKRKRSRR